VIDRQTPASNTTQLGWRQIANHWLVPTNPNVAFKRHIYVWRIVAEGRNTMEATMDSLVVLLLISMWLYLIPAVIADLRKHHNRWAIFWTNLFLGWTFLGWVGAFIWACTNPAPASTNPAPATR